MDPGELNAEEFLKQSGRHFVLLGCTATLPDGTKQNARYSGFLADVAGARFFITAGHVFSEMARFEAKGVTFDWFHLNDRLDQKRPAGEFCPPLPLFLDRDRCIVVNEAWGDYAAYQLDDIVIAGLEKGGAKWIEEVAWGPSAKMDEYAKLVMIGIPTESIKEQGGHTDAALSLIPLKLVPAPGHIDPPPHERRVFAELIRSAGGVQDIEGMSGGPIYGFKMVEGVWRYSVAGIQSGWYKPIVFFHPAAPFLRTLKGMVMQSSD